MIQLFLLLFVINGALSQANLRMFGGTDANKNEFPYMVSIKNRADNLHLCGGSIITKRTVLSAAHCVYITNRIGKDQIENKPRHRNDIYLYAGSESLSSGGTQYRVEKIIEHPNWTYRKPKPTVGSLSSDIALLITEFPFVLSKSLNIIPLDFSTNVGVGVEVDIPGWGSTEKEVYVDKLQKIKSKTISSEQCWKAYNKEKYSVEAFSKSTLKSSICAYDGKHSTCYGDSGGPLVLNKKQIGVASRGDVKCGTGDPDIFIRVDKFEKFITENKVE